MKLLLLSLLLVFLCLAQIPTTPPASDGPPFEIGPTLPANQRAMLIKADHKKNVEDADALLKLAEAVKTELDKEDAQVISVKTLKQTEDIERLAKSIHGRLKRY